MSTLVKEIRASSVLASGEVIEMKCTIPGANLKVVARAVHALARIGEDLYFEPNEDALSLKSVNAGRSAYASFTFHQSFFSYYSYTPSSDQSEASAQCKISMRSCLPVFRSPVNLDRKVENCLVSVEDNGSKLVFEMRFFHGMVKTYFLPVIESRILQVVFTKTPEMDCFNASAQVFAESFHNFSNSQEEITFQVSPDSLFIRSYSDGSSQSSKMKSTEISLSVSELNKYWVKKENSITFSHKEFRALLSFAEATNSDIEANFGMEGKPIYFSLKHERTYEADFILSTVYPELVSQSMTPQELRLRSFHSDPVISGESSAVVNAQDPPLQKNPRTSRANPTPTSTPPSANCPVQEGVPDFGLNVPEQPIGASIERGESPSLMSMQSSKVRSGTSRQTNLDTSRKKHCTNLSVAGREAERITSQTSNTRERTPSTSYDMRRQRAMTTPSPLANPGRVESPDCVESSQALRPSSVNRSIHRTLSPGNDSQNIDSQLLMTMSDMSSVSLRLRESDNESLSLPEPARKFRRMFTATLDVNSIPGHNVIIINDSDEEVS